MATSNFTEHCSSCKFYQYETCMCRRFPKAEMKPFNGWCGEYAIKIEETPVEKPKNKGGRPRKVVV